LARHSTWLLPFPTPRYFTVSLNFIPLRWLLPLELLEQTPVDPEEDSQARPGARARRGISTTRAAGLRPIPVSRPAGKNLAEARLAGNNGRLRGWAYRIRTAESAPALTDWICAATSAMVGSYNINARSVAEFAAAKKRPRPGGGRAD
jgi:hypothetical protein